MSSTAENGHLAKFAKSRWWLVSSTIAPALVGGFLVLGAGREFARSREAAEAAQNQVHALQAENAQRTRENEELKKELETHKAAVAAQRDERTRLEAEIAALTAQREQLALTVSAPNVDEEVNHVRTSLAARTPRERARALQRRGDEALMIARPDIARRFYEAALVEDADYPSAMISLGALASSKKDFREAESWFKQAIAASDKKDKKDPLHYGWALLDLMNLLMAQYKFEEANKYADLLRNADQKPAPAEEYLRRLDAALAKHRRQ
ncbi:MAG: hypothetical protein KC657_38100 [Myxococcales bacterium]|nr:hypothetical protein [Myxococcales bacterium]